MNCHYKNICIIFFSLFIFASNGLAQRDYWDYSGFLEKVFLQAVQGDDIEHVEYLLRSGIDVNATDEFGRTAAMLATDNGMRAILEPFLRRDGRYECASGYFDYIIDVRPEYSEPTPGEEIIVNLHGDVEPVGGVGNTIRLELVFSLRQYVNSVETFQVGGIGESRNFQGGFAVNIFGSPIGIGVDEHPSNTVEDVVKNAISDGYEKLRNSLGDNLGLWQKPLRSTISQVGANTILVPLGTSDYIQLGDDFFVYSDPGHCNMITDPYIVRAKVIEIGDERSIMEIEDALELVQVQVGDVVVIDPSIDLVSRKQGSDEPSVLKIGVIPDISVTYLHNGRGSKRQITPLIRQYLITISRRELGFRIVL